MFVGVDNYYKYNEEADRIGRWDSLPCASIAYVVNEPGSLNIPIVDVAFALRNPVDSWKRSIGRSIAQERLDNWRSGKYENFAFSFYLDTAMYHTFDNIKCRFDLKKFNQWEALSWNTLELMVVDHAEEWYSYMRGWIQTSEVLKDIASFQEDE